MTTQARQDREAVVAPVAPQERIQAIDVLRGWAIFGILLVDIDALHAPEATWAALDRAVYRCVDLFAGSKFWTLLSFLFGLGFSLQVERAERPGFLSAFTRRMLALLLIGILQIILLMWGGHFLVRYAVLGFLLLPLRRVSTRALLPLAALAMLLSWSYSASVSLIREQRLARPETRAETMRAEAQASAARAEFNRERGEARSAGYLQRLAFQARGFYVSYFTGLFLGSPLAYVTWLSQFGMFLMGFYVGRRRILQDVTKHLPLIGRVFGWGAALGLAVVTARSVVPEAAAQSPILRHTVRLLTQFGDPALAFAYGAGLLLLLERGWCRSLLLSLVPAGRMALTNYLLMAVVVGVLAPAFGYSVYSGPGYKGIPPTIGVALAVAIYGVLVLLSHWWLRRFRFGPAEWLWRSATYGRWQPMRLERVQLAAGRASAK